MIFNLKNFILWLNSMVWNCTNPIHLLKVIIFIYIIYTIFNYLIKEVIIGNYVVEQNRKAREKRKKAKKTYRRY